MEMTAEADLFTLWLTQYGSFVLFFLLSLGILALPIPEETLMVMSGILMHKGTLNIPLTIFFCYVGTMTGITTSYLLGRTAGHYLILKYGRWVGITPARLEKGHQWFSRLGKWLLMIGYFIPGIRHLTGFSAGTTSMGYSQFAIFAYSGAIMWVSLFLSLGYFLGGYCLACYEKLEELDVISIAILIIAAIVTIFIIRRRSLKG
jgi:membrane protein DedA with SNARE-associated domain